jgi:hypothetical protein
MPWGPFQQNLLEFSAVATPLISEEACLPESRAASAVSTHLLTRSGSLP